MTRYDCADPEERAAGISAAVDAVRAGRLVVLPTDTVYGIGADAFNPAAVEALMHAKRRGPQMPVGVLVGSWNTIDGLALMVPDEARLLVRAFWPGALSLVITHAPSLHWNLGNARGTVMVRMPLQPVALEVLRTVGPMAVSSANVSGRDAAVTAVDAEGQLADAADVYLDAGAAPRGVASTIVDLTGDTPRILRQGPVAPAEIAEVLGTDPAELSG